MTDFNQAIVLGNLTRDPELRYTPNGQAVANFAVATNRRWKNAQGQIQEETEFHNVVAWGKLADICSQILYKGRKILVTGRIRTRNWEAQDGTRRSTTEIVADNICATGAPKTTGETALEEKVSTKEPAQIVEEAKDDKKSEKQKSKTEEKTAKSDEEEINLDDIPF